MVLHLVSNPDSPFYSSNNFSKVIQFAQANQRTAHLRETTDRLSLSIDKVDSITAALSRLNILIKNEE
jgi:transcription-repair coupling factor (superfamily II helicase)